MASTQGRGWLPVCHTPSALTNEERAHQQFQTFAQTEDLLPYLIPMTQKQLLLRSANVTRIKQTVTNEPGWHVGGTQAVFLFLHLFLVENTVQCGGSLRSRREKRPGKLRPALRRWAKLLRARPRVLVTRGPGLVAERAGLTGSPRVDSWVLEACPRTQSRGHWGHGRHVGPAGLAAAAWLRSRRVQATGD